MRIPLALVLLLAALVSDGCLHRKKAVTETVSGQAPAAASTPAPTTLIVTPGNGLTGKVVRYNAAGRFVVLEFPVGQMAALEQRLFVYRDGLKVGELKVTGPQRDDHIVADVTSGEALAGDEVREQ
jgi:hypothetical protein